VQDEQSLVRRAQGQDREAFAELYEAYFDKIYRYIALKIGDKVEAEDMTQQVFLKALKSLPGYKWKDVPFSAWLYRIAHNQTVDHFRKASRQQSCELTEEITPSDPSENPERETEIKMDIEHLVAATKHLTKAQRDVISLRFTSDLPIAEVARIMGKSEGAIKALQHSAVASLKRIMVVAETNE
jgi:RNA polymerase sigma-70 factor (ECF subfamily)